MNKLFALFAILIFSIPFYTNAQGIDLLWQGDTYTPPFYKGRPLWTDQSRVIIVAIPDITGGSNLFYKWSKNGTVLGGANGVNGIGQNSLIFTSSIIGRPQEINLDLLSSDKAVLASASINLDPTYPELLIYEDNPLYGLLFHREVGGRYNLTDEEVTLKAFPMFFSVENPLQSSLDFTWRTGGNTNKESSVTYRIPDGASGTSEIFTQIKNTERILQSASKNFTLQFGDK